MKKNKRNAMWLLAGTFGLVSASASAQVVEYLHTDALGTPVAVTDANRVVIERSDYEPYGQLLNRAANDSPGYTGHVEDKNTGLTYMQQRYYDSDLGVFLSVDPVTPFQNQGSPFNRYWYANNNPFKFSDPDGRQSVSRGPGGGQPEMVRNWVNKLTVVAEKMEAVRNRVDAELEKVDVRLQLDIAMGMGVSIDQSLLHGDGSISFTPVAVNKATGGSGVFVGAFLQPREPFTINKQENRTKTPASMSYGASIGDGFSFGADIEVSADKQVDVTPKVGIGVGQIQKLGPDIKLFRWDLEPKDGDGKGNN